MEPAYGHELFSSDRDAYLSAFWDLEGAYEWDEAELDLVNALAFFLGKDVEGIPQIVAMGYLAGCLEAWQPELTEYRLTTIWRDSIESDMAEKFDEDWDIPAWSRIMYSIFEFRNALLRFAFDPPHLFDRLGAVADSVGERVYPTVSIDTKSFAEWKKNWRELHLYGVALRLYVTWLDLMDELDIPEHERWTDNLEARPVSDELMSFDFPIDIGKCELDREDLVGGYEIRSQGRLGAQHRMRFRAMVSTAEIVGILTEGRRSIKTLDVPFSSHVDVLRTLGFQEMIFPNKKRYEIRVWPGIRRIKD